MDAVAGSSLQKNLGTTTRMRHRIELTEQDIKSGVHDEKFRPGPVLLLGAPGVGKGTQAQRLMAAFAIPQISTGDLLRQHVRERTDLGMEAKLRMDQGQLVPDEMVNAMVASRLQQNDTRAGYILDGFPRTPGQADWLDALLPRLDQPLPLIALQIHVNEAELLLRITGRRTCPSCGRIYNVHSHRPQVEGVCDFDQTPLQHRSDDTVAAFGERMAEYERKTAPVIEHYRAQGRFAEVNGAQSSDDVEAELIQQLRRLRDAGAVVHLGEQSWRS